TRPNLNRPSLHYATLRLCQVSAAPPPRRSLPAAPSPPPLRQQRTPGALLLRPLRVEGRRSRGYIEKNCRRNRTCAFLDEKLAGPRLGFSMMGQTRKTAFRSVCGLVACTV